MARTHAERTRGGATMGPLHRRARRSLLEVASQFGTVFDEHTDAQDSETNTDLAVMVHVTRGRRHGPITLSYGKADYLFSRVYDLKVIGYGEWGGPPTPLRVKFSRDGGHFEVGPRVPPEHAARARTMAATLERNFAANLASVDLKSVEIVNAGDGQFKVELVPLGGAYVWLLVPPVSYSVRFPDGEQGRLLELMRGIRDVLANN